MPAAAPGASAMMAVHAHRSEVGGNAPRGTRNCLPSQLSAAGEARHAPFARDLPNEIGPIMKILRFVGSQFYAAYALGAVLLGAVALTALGSLIPDNSLSALRSLIPARFRSCSFCFSVGWASGSAV